MLKIALTTAVTLALLCGTALSADPIVGNWRTQSGETALIATCGGGSFCITLKTGTYAGKSIGELVNAESGYTGTVTDPATDKTYRGKASISGTSMKMSGCVLGGLFCQTQTWTRK